MGVVTRHEGRRAALALMLGMALVGCQVLPAQVSRDARSGATARSGPRPGIERLFRPRPVASPQVVTADALDVPRGRVSAPTTVEVLGPGAAFEGDWPAERVQPFDAAPGSLLEVIAAPGARLVRTAIPAAWREEAAREISRCEVPGAPRVLRPRPRSASAQAPAPGFRPWRLLSQPAPRSVGSEESFWVYAFDGENRPLLSRRARLMRVSEHAYFYLDLEGLEVPADTWERLAEAFESRIYPRVTQALDHAVGPGVDGDPRVFVVVSPAVSNWGSNHLGGYVRGADMHADTTSERTNYKEILFLADDRVAAGGDHPGELLAHEFQHVVNHLAKGVRLGEERSEHTWLNEGMANYAESLCGYGLRQGSYAARRHAELYLEQPSAFALNDWQGNPYGFAYGQTGLFVHYLVERFGEALLAQIAARDDAGLAAVSAVLAPHGTTLAELYRDWAVTNLIGAEPLAEGTVYRYGNPGTHGTLTALARIEATPPQEAPAMRLWGCTYQRLGEHGGASLYRYRMRAPQSARLTGAVVLPDPVR